MTKKSLSLTSLVCKLQKWNVKMAETGADGRGKEEHMSIIVSTRTEHATQKT